MNEFLSTLETCSDLQGDSFLRRTKLTTLQANLGNLCNQSCLHCHVDASPMGKKVASRKVIDDIIAFLSSNRDLTLDITGGAPELNPYFDYFLINARPIVNELIVRSNLTVFFEEDKAYLPHFFREHNVHLICSLPCYSESNVDAQRGNGVFKKSIESLRLLNKIGYSRKNNLLLDVVYNPNGAYLPPLQEELEKEYRKNLSLDYGVNFNKLITITNVPIKRFKHYLRSQGQYGKYLNILKKNFNPQIVNSIMCRTFLSVGYDGKIYDCDFNQSLGWALKDKNGRCLTIEKLNLEDLAEREIMLGEHCFSCTAGYGSSCQGSLAKDEGLETGSGRELSSLTECAQSRFSSEREADLNGRQGLVLGSSGPAAKQVASSKGAEDLDSLKDAIITQEAVKSYYGKVLKNKKDLKTSACCAGDSNTFIQRKILKRIHPEILDKFYGCGSPIPPLLEGRRILDLGCGTGKDVYISSYLAGEEGSVIGVDMTDEQLAVAGRHLDYQMKEFGFKKANVEFKQGYIEDLKAIGIEDNSIDVVISNCVINLSPSKEAVFAEIFRVLKPGGELYFSDIFSGRRIPEQLKSDPVLYGECLGGSLYIEDFRRILRNAGCLDYRIISKRKIVLDNPEIEAKVGGIDFWSLTVRAFKLSSLEDICEDYGQVAVYSGTIPEYPHIFTLDDHHIFVAGKPMLVCGNTASMLQETRYSGHFRVGGDRTVHFGPFNCAPASEKISPNDREINIGGACC